MVQNQKSTEASTGERCRLLDILVCLFFFVYVCKAHRSVDLRGAAEAENTDTNWRHTRSVGSDSRDINTSNSNQSNESGSSYSSENDSIWNSTFGFLMYFLMVLFFALQITLLLFCLGIFVKKICCDSYPDDPADSQVHIGNINLGHTPDCQNDSYDEKKQKILKYLKDPSNKDCIIFSPAPDSPLVNNWVGAQTDSATTISSTSPPVAAADEPPTPEPTATQSYLSVNSASSTVRPESQLSLNTVDSSVNVLSNPNPRWMCPICLNCKEVHTIGLPCKHSYHKECLKDYVVYSLEHNLPFKCPICRCNLQINIDYKQKEFLP